MSKSFTVTRRNGDKFRFIVDDDKLDEVMQWKWSVLISEHRTYAYRRKLVGEKKTMIFLHHQIIGRPPEGMITDHINGDGKDNRRDNLRHCSQQGNTQNMRKRPNKTSQLKGAFFAKHANKWRASITLNGRNIHLGYHDDEQSAHAAYCEAGKKLFGEFFRAQ